MYADTRTNVNNIDTHVKMFFTDIEYTIVRYTKAYRDRIMFYTMHCFMDHNRLLTQTFFIVDTTTVVIINFTIVILNYFDALLNLTL